MFILLTTTYLSSFHDRYTKIVVYKLQVLFFVLVTNTNNNTNDSLKNSKNIVLSLVQVFFYAHVSKYDNMEITNKMIKEGLSTKTETKSVPFEIICWSMVMWCLKKGQFRFKRNVWSLQCNTSKVIQNNLYIYNIILHCYKINERFLASQ